MASNVQTKLEGKTLVIRVDLSKKGEPSKSGKSLVIASTGGFTEVQAGVKLALNVIRGHA